LVDWDGDGRPDIVSGSWPGEVYWFRRGVDGRFAAGQPLRDRHGNVLNLGFAAAAIAADWDGDGDLDWLVGTLTGEVSIIPNEGDATRPALGEPRPLVAGSAPIKVNGDAAPVAADWDGDGRLDLIVGAEDGSVVWYRNLGPIREPRLAEARTLIEKSPLGWGDDTRRTEGDWGLRVKICAVDANGDGRLDLLVGDRCGGFQAKPRQDDREKDEEHVANDKLPELMRKWAATMHDYRKLLDTPEPATAEESQARAHRLDSLRKTLRRFKDEIAMVQDIQSHYRPQWQSHGFVWLFARKPGPRPNSESPPLPPPS
jgi:hypothetical protein